MQTKDETPIDPQALALCIIKAIEVGAQPELTLAEKGRQMAPVLVAAFGQDYLHQRHAEYARQGRDDPFLNAVIAYADGDDPESLQ